MKEDLVIPNLEDVGSLASVAKDNPNIMNSPVMAFIMQAAQLGKMTKLAKLAEDKMSHGFTDSLNPIATEHLDSWGMVNPAQSVSLINDGPNTVLIWINDHASAPNIILNGETFQLDFEGHKLASIYYQCAPGQTAALRIVVKE